MIGETAIFLAMFLGGVLLAVDGSFVASYIAADVTREPGTPSIFEERSGRDHHDAAYEAMYKAEEERWLREEREEDQESERYEEQAAQSETVESSINTLRERKHYDNTNPNDSIRSERSGMHTIMT